LILRVPLLYGEVETLDENAVTILFKNIKNTETRVKMDEYEEELNVACLSHSIF
jgi:S-adenosylmethionine synthetase